MTTKARIIPPRPLSIKEPQVQDDKQAKFIIAAKLRLALERVGLDSTPRGAKNHVLGVTRAVKNLKKTDEDVEVMTKKLNDKEKAFIEGKKADLLEDLFPFESEHNTFGITSSARNVRRPRNSSVMDLDVESISRPLVKAALNIGAVNYGKSFKGEWIQFSEPDRDVAELLGDVYYCKSCISVKHLSELSLLKSIEALLSVEEISLNWSTLRLGEWPEKTYCDLKPLILDCQLSFDSYNKLSTQCVVAASEPHFLISASKFPSKTYKASPNLTWSCSLGKLVTQ